MWGMATDPGIGTKIRKRRQELGLTQAQLADRVGADESSVINWESGRHFPKRKLGAIEAVLGISLDGDGGGMKIVSPAARRVLRAELDDEDYRRVIGLLEGTLTWPAAETGPQAREAASDGARGDGRPAG